MTASTAIMQVRSSAAMRGRVLALQAIVFVGSTPIGGPLLGVVCDRYGARAGLVLGGVAALAAAGWGLLADRRLTRALRATDTAESAGVSGPAVGGGQGVDHQGAIVTG